MLYDAPLGIHIIRAPAKIHLMFQQPDLFDAMRSMDDVPSEALNLPMLIERLAQVSARPRYAFLVLNLIAKAAGNNSRSAGPYVEEADQRIPLRDWLCDALLPIAKRDARRIAIVNDVTAKLLQSEQLPSDARAAARLVDEEVKARVRQSGRCNVSRAVSDLVRAGLVRRHYQGYRVDHQNRGAQREAVYTITDVAAAALRV